MKILVAGGRGYVGARICVHLIAEGHDVVVQSRRLAPALGWAKDRVATCSLSDPAGLRVAMAGSDTVIHLATPNEIAVADAPQAAASAAVDAASSILAVARESCVGQFIYVSSAHVYGAPLAGHIDEARQPVPANAYGRMRRDIEELVLARSGGAMPAGLVLRVSNVIGAPVDAEADRWTLITNDLCRQAVERRALILRTPGLQQRDFVCADDIAGAVSHFANLHPRGEGIYNLGGGTSLSMFELAELVADRCVAILGYRPAIERPAPQPADTAAALDFCIDKIRAAGFAPSNDFASAIDATLRYCRERFG